MSNDIRLDETMASHSIHKTVKNALDKNEGDQRSRNITRLARNHMYV